MIDERLAKRALMSWGVGRSYIDSAASSTGAAVVMVERPEHVVDALGSGVVGDGGVLFVPDTTADVPTPEHMSVLRYQGDPSEPAGELSVGEDVFVQTQDYATAEYMSVIGPTLLRMLVPEDFPALVSDLDRAAADGAFPEYLLHPASQLGDRSALGGSAASDGPRVRLHLRPDETWSVGPLGAAIGTLGDDFSAIEDAWRRGETQGGAGSLPLGRVVPEATRSAALGTRPWFGHALSAVIAQQDLRARGIRDVSVSGFGGRLNPALDDGPVVTDSPWEMPHASTPILCWTDETAYFHLPDSGRTFRISRDAAMAFEAIFATGGAAEAARFAPADMVEAAMTQLNAEGAALGGPRVE